MLKSYIALPDKSDTNSHGSQGWPEWEIRTKNLQSDASDSQRLSNCATKRPRSGYLYRSLTGTKPRFVESRTAHSWWRHYTRWWRAVWSLLQDKWTLYANQNSIAWKCSKVLKTKRGTRIPNIHILAIPFRINRANLVKKRKNMKTSVQTAKKVCEPHSAATSLPNSVHRTKQHGCFLCIWHFHELFSQALSITVTSSSCMWLFSFSQFVSDTKKLIILAPSTNVSPTTAVLFNILA